MFFRRLRPGTLSADFNLSGGCFCTDNHPKMHEMVSYRSSRAEFLTNLGEIAMRVSFNSTKMWNNDNMVDQKHRIVVFSEKQSLRSRMPHTKVVKNKQLDII